jgi:putative acyl-CoA dehydrogenase
VLKLAADSTTKGTHVVANQAPPLVDYNLFTTDRALSDGLDREGAGWMQTRLADFGQRAGSEEAIHWGFQANQNPPALHTHNRFGNRIDEIEFHPAWHELMRLAIENGLASLPWADPRPGAQVARTALMFLAAQNEAGHTCPVSMTSSAIPALRNGCRAFWPPAMTRARFRHPKSPVY